jgi:hypothetical protein
MPKFFAIFLLQRSVFDKIRPNFLLNRPVFGGRIFELSSNSADNSVNSTEFRSSKIFLFFSHVNCISAEFSWFSMIFSEFFKMRRNRWETIFHCSSNFVTLGMCNTAVVFVGNVFFLFSIFHCLSNFVTLGMCNTAVVFVGNVFFCSLDTKSKLVCGPSPKISPAQTLYYKS